jgi:hypothetical protein
VDRGLRADTLGTVAGVALTERSSNLPNFDKMIKVTVLQMSQNCIIFLFEHHLCQIVYMSGIVHRNVVKYHMSHVRMN